MTVELNVKQVAEMVGGEIIRGREGAAVRRVMPIGSAAPDAITFITKAKYLPQVRTTRAAILLAEPSMISRDDVVLPDGLAVVGVERPYVAFARVAQALAQRIPRPEGVHPTAVIEPGARVGRDVAIGPFVYVGTRAEIGEGCVLYPGVHVEEGAKVGAGAILYNHVVIRHGCRIGERCILHSGVVIGSDGFGFAQDPEPEQGKFGVNHVKIPQVGDVCIEDEVEIGANSCVDRGTLGTTKVGAGTKIDNLVQIGHNVEIGPSCILVAQSGVAGSSKLGRAVTMGAQSGVSGHIEVGDGVTVLGQSGVIQDLPAGEKVCGSPSVSATEFFRTVVRVNKLDDLTARVRKLERALAEKS